jgi:hypothetical protein
MHMDPWIIAFGAAGSALATGSLWWVISTTARCWRKV